MCDNCFDLVHSEEAPRTTELVNKPGWIEKFEEHCETYQAFRPYPKIRYDGSRETI